MTTVAITGATGRVGHAVVAEALARGLRVIAIDRVEPADLSDPHVEFRAADTSDHDGFEQAVRGAEALIHLAAFPSPNGRPDHVVHNNNVVGSYNALSIATHLGIHRVAQASSINATGAAFSRSPRYDYFPLDELHPTYNEDPYSLSKWICEAQADSLCRRHADLSLASMRIHLFVPDRATAVERTDEMDATMAAHHLWGYSEAPAVARAFLAAIERDLGGHEVFYLTAPRTAASRATADLVREHYPDVALRHSLRGDESLYDTSKAARLLNWTHPRD